MDSFKLVPGLAYCALDMLRIWNGQKYYRGFLRQNLFFKDAIQDSVES